IVSVTSARPSAARPAVPAKTTSSILPPRSDFTPCWPITHEKASTTLDLAEPFGPTTQVMPGSNRSVVAEAKDLKPRSVRVFRYTACSPHQPVPCRQSLPGSSEPYSATRGGMTVQPFGTTLVWRSVRPRPLRPFRPAAKLPARPRLNTERTYALAARRDLTACRRLVAPRRDMDNNGETGAAAALSEPVHLKRASRNRPVGPRLAVLAPGGRPPDLRRGPEAAIGGRCGP